MSKEVEYVVVTYEQFTDYEFIPPATFYIMSATQDYYFFKTSDRAKAQACCDELFDGKYAVKASRNQATKFRSESGEVSCRGTNSRKGFASHLRPTV